MLYLKHGNALEKRAGNQNREGMGHARDTDRKAKPHRGADQGDQQNDPGGSLLCRYPYPDQVGCECPGQGPGEYLQRSPRELREGFSCRGRSPGQGGQGQRDPGDPLEVPVIDHRKGGRTMSFDTLITLLIIGGLGYMMFRGGGCCGSHGSHKGHHGKDDQAGNGNVGKANEDR